MRAQHRGLGSQKDQETPKQHQGGGFQAFCLTNSKVKINHKQEEESKQALFSFFFRIAGENVRGKTSIKASGPSK